MNAPRRKTVPLAWLTGPLLHAMARRRVAEWDRAARDPDAAQRAILAAHCRAAAATEFGRIHFLDEIRTPAEFAARVPLRTFDQLAPWIGRMRRGEPDVLWPGRVRYFAKSAGTSRPGTLWKELPVSDEQVRWQRKMAFDILARYLAASGDRRFTAGFSLGLLPPPEIVWDGDIGVTSNPGLVHKTMPAVSRLYTLPRSPIVEIHEYDRKLDEIADAYLDWDVRAVCGTTCWFAPLFERVIAAARARGRRVSTVAEVWPNLSALFGGGVNALAYRGVIDERVGKRLPLVDNYNATEGGALAVTDETGDLLVVPDRGVFFEFVPRGEVGLGGARRLTLAEVETGVDYAVAVTTPSGLWAYLLGDVVRFTSTFPHRLRFVGRLAGEISLAHEKTTPRQIEDAVGRAAARHECAVAEFAAAGEVAGGLARYLLFVEFARAPDDAAAFARSVDAAVCDENWLYKLARERDVAIAPLAVVPLARGTAQRFAGAAGRKGLQQKFPRILDGEKRDLLRALAAG